MNAVIDICCAHISVTYDLHFRYSMKDATEMHLSILHIKKIITFVKLNVLTQIGNHIFHVVITDSKQILKNCSYEIKKISYKLVIKIFRYQITIFSNIPTLLRKLFHLFPQKE